MVTMKASPHPIAANRSLVLLIRILDEYSCDKLSNSDVIKSIIDVDANHKLKSVSVKGMFI